MLRGHWFARKGGLDWLPLREDVSEQLEYAYRSQVLLEFLDMSLICLVEYAYRKVSEWNDLPHFSILYEIKSASLFVKLLINYFLVYDDLVFFLISHNESKIPCFQVWHRRTFQPSGLFAARVDLQGSTSV